MTNTYFIRHSSDLDVDHETLDSMWEGNYFGIHYPEDKSKTIAQGDSRSLNPEDYEDYGRSCLQRLHDLAKDGGYVFATYRDKPGGRVGYVKPGSTVDLYPGRWGSGNGLNGRQAWLKVLKLEKARNLSAVQSISLISVQPRQGTFCQWHKVGSRVEAILNGVVKIELGSLTPDLQEVMCMEYLRSELAGHQGLPILAHTLSPVGRTLKDLDILGISKEGRVIAAQVTFSPLDESMWKLEKLDDYASQEVHTIYFCECAEPQLVRGHQVFPIRKVFEEFCMSSPLGRRWFNTVAGGVL